MDVELCRCVCVRACTQSLSLTHPNFNGNVWSFSSYLLAPFVKLHVTYLLTVFSLSPSGSWIWPVEFVSSRNLGVRVVSSWRLFVEIRCDVSFRDPMRPIGRVESPQLFPRSVLFPPPPQCAFEWVRAYVCVCVRAHVCVCVRAHVCVYVCVRVWVWSCGMMHSRHVLMHLLRNACEKQEDGGRSRAATRNAFSFFLQ